MRAALAEAAPGGWPGATLEIRSGPAGAPFAAVAREARAASGFAPGTPLPVAVSISHAEGRALCAAVWTGAGGGPGALGIDLGLVERRSLAFLATFLTDDERAFVAAAAPHGRALRANLVWCAKEAVLKAFGLGLTVDTYGLTCLPDPDGDGSGPPLADPRGWLPFLARCGGAVVPGGEIVRGAWRTLPGGFVGALTWRVAPEAALRVDASPGASRGRDTMRDRHPAPGARRC